MHSNGGYLAACLRKDHYGRWRNGISQRIEAALWNRRIQWDLFHTLVSGVLHLIILSEAVFVGLISRIGLGQNLSKVSYTGALSATYAVGKDIEELEKNPTQMGA